MAMDREVVDQYDIETIGMAIDSLNEWNELTRLMIGSPDIGAKMMLSEGRWEDGVWVHKKVRDLELVIDRLDDLKVHLQEATDYGN